MVRFIQWHSEVKLSLDVFQIYSSKNINRAAARAVDREFNYKFGSHLGLLGSGRGSNGRGAPIGFIWAEFQLKRSHCDPFRDQNHVCETNSSLVLTNYYSVLTN